jgi:hypothetical protein
VRGFAGGGYRPQRMRLAPSLPILSKKNLGGCWSSNRSGQEQFASILSQKDVPEALQSSRAAVRDRYAEQRRAA